jgi:hypothetical protein
LIILDDTQQILAGVVPPELLPVLGLTPVLGRTFTANDEGQRTVVLGWWND